MVFRRESGNWTFWAVANTCANARASGRVHDWIHVGSQCGKIRLFKPFGPRLRCIRTVSPRPFAAFRDTIGTQFEMKRYRCFHRCFLNYSSLGRLKIALASFNPAMRSSA